MKQRLAAGSDTQHGFSGKLLQSTHRRGGSLALSSFQDAWWNISLASDYNKRVEKVAVRHFCARAMHG